MADFDPYLEAKRQQDEEEQRRRDEEAAIRIQEERLALEQAAALGVLGGPQTPEQAAQFQAAAQPPPQPQAPAATIPAEFIQQPGEQIGVAEALGGPGMQPDVVSGVDPMAEQAQARMEAEEKVAEVTPEEPELPLSEQIKQARGQEAEAISERERLGLEMGGIKEETGVLEGQKEVVEASARQEKADTIEQYQAKREAAHTAAEKLRADLNEKRKNFEFNPWKDKNGFQKLAAGISVFLGGMLMPYTGRNIGLEMVNRELDRESQAQKMEFDDLVSRIKESKLDEADKLEAIGKAEAMMHVKNAARADSLIDLIEQKQAELGGRFDNKAAQEAVAMLKQKSAADTAETAEKLYAAQQARELAARQLDAKARQRLPSKEQTSSQSAPQSLIASTFERTAAMLPEGGKWDGGKDLWRFVNLSVGDDQRGVMHTGTTTEARDTKEYLQRTRDYSNIADRLARKLKKHGRELTSEYLASPEGEDILQDFNALKLIVKDLEKLGVVAGPDEGLMIGQISANDPTTILRLGRDPARQINRGLQGYIDRANSRIRNETIGWEGGRWDPTKGLRVTDSETGDVAEPQGDSAGEKQLAHGGKRSVRLKGIDNILEQGKYEKWMRGKSGAWQPTQAEVDADIRRLEEAKATQQDPAVLKKIDKGLELLKQVNTRLPRQEVKANVEQKPELTSRQQEAVKAFERVRGGGGMTSPEELMKGLTSRRHSK